MLPLTLQDDKQDDIEVYVQENKTFRRSQLLEVVNCLQTTKLEGNNVLGTGSASVLMQKEGEKHLHCRPCQMGLVSTLCFSRLVFLKPA